MEYELYDKFNRIRQELQPGDVDFRGNSVHVARIESHDEWSDRMKWLDETQENGGDVPKTATQTAQQALSHNDAKDIRAYCIQLVGCNTNNQKLLAQVVAELEGLELEDAELTVRYCSELPYSLNYIFDRDNAITASMKLQEVGGCLILKEYYGNSSYRVVDSFDEAKRTSIKLDDQTDGLIANFNAGSAG